MGCRLWGRTGSDRTEVTQQQQHGGMGASQAALAVKNLPANAGDMRDAGLIPGSRRSPGGEHGNPF